MISVFLLVTATWSDYRVRKNGFWVCFERNEKKMFGLADDDTVGDGKRREMRDSETNALKGSILARG